MPFEKGHKYGSLSKSTPKSHLLGQKMREDLVKHITVKFSKYKRAFDDLALGHFREEMKKDGRVRIYQVSPDGATLKYLADQAIGKPMERMEVAAGIIVKMDV